MGVLRLFYWREDGGASQVEGQLSVLGARRAGLWRLHCATYSVKGGGKDGAKQAKTPMWVLTAEGGAQVFALRGGQVLQGGPELQHILAQATAERPKGKAHAKPEPLKPRQTGTIEGARYELGDFVICVGHARVSERLKGQVVSIEYRPCTQWDGLPPPTKRRKTEPAAAGAGDGKASPGAAGKAEAEVKVKTEAKEPEAAQASKEKEEAGGGS